MIESIRHAPSNGAIARGFGWFSVALGVAELMMPRAVARMSGLSGSEALVRAYGMREIVTGIGLLTTRRPAPWMWARVAGDMLDAGTLARAGTVEARTALSVVAAVTAADVACAAAFTARPSAPQMVRDYSDRSGLPRSPDEMRGLAREDFEMPADMRTPAALRPQTA